MMDQIRVEQMAQMRHAIPFKQRPPKPIKVKVEALKSDIDIEFIKNNSGRARLLDMYNKIHKVQMVQKEIETPRFPRRPI